jgi:hypothetical protein
MPLNITVHDPLRPVHGAMPQAPGLTAATAAQIVALGAASAGIAGPALVCLIPDEDCRIAASRTGGYVAPAAAGIKLKMGSERFFTLADGTWYVSVIAG